ncbi:MAG: hypothetical protein JNL41_13550 [Phenylobacterium sp.]|uniref:DUF6886 family protein n=1 Tax=Phenylobacterium sp. TaxID=1871053 RepID=UPI001A5C2752|nr:DUF6886 family protein [Phenylobacterium sp.]MBL8555298.1 hypothetical protein [Phenylobacterium sp.]
MALRLFHVSEELDIARFEPRPSPSTNTTLGVCVWSICEAHLPNYLLPRDCPRVCFRRGPRTTDEDAGRILGGADHVVAFPATWLEAVRRVQLAVYEMPSQTFFEANAEAGYWISRNAVEPVRRTLIDDALGALVGAGVEVRVLQDIWPLRDAVVGSSLRFSIIRCRNAEPRLG